MKLLCSEFAEQVVSSHIGEIYFFLAEGHESAPPPHAHARAPTHTHTHTRIVCCEVVVDDLFM